MIILYEINKRVNSDTVILFTDMLIQMQIEWSFSGRITHAQYLL